MPKPHIFRVLAIATALAVGVTGPAAGAAVTAATQYVLIEWAGQGSFADTSEHVKVADGKTVTLTHTATNVPEGQTPVVQVWDGRWVTFGDAEFDPVTGKATVIVGKGATIKELRGAPGKQLSVRIGFARNAAYPYDRFTGFRYIDFDRATPKVSDELPYPGAKSFRISSKTPKSKTIKVTGDIQWIVVQRKDTTTKKWVNVAVHTPTKSSGNVHTFKVNVQNWNSPSGYSFRLYIPEHAGVKEWTGPAQKVKWPRYATSASAYTLGDTSLTSVIKPKKVKVWFTGGKRTVKLQSYVKGRWLTKATKKTGADHYVTFTLPKYKHGRVAKFRAYAPATDLYAAAKTQTQKVKYQDPRKLKGMLKTVRGYIKSKCKSATLALESKRKTPNWAGSAYIGADHIIVYKRLNPRNKTFLRYLAYHECSHLLTGVAADKYGVTDYRKKLDKMFKAPAGKGIEWVADAMSIVWGASKSQAYYHKKFTKTQLGFAKHILNGKWPRSFR